MDESELVQVHGGDSWVQRAIMLHLYKEAIRYFSFLTFRKAPWASLDPHVYVCIYVYVHVYPYVYVCVHRALAT